MPVSASSKPFAAPTTAGSVLAVSATPNPTSAVPTGDFGTGTKLATYYILRGATCAPYAVSADHVFYPTVSEVDVSTLAAGSYSH